MKKNIKPLDPGTFYHVYNRGNNGQNIFFEKRNYALFLQKYAKYVSPVADTYAYCLLGNHFHILIRTKSEKEITLFKGDRVLNPVSLEAGKIVSLQFSHLFNSYTQTINKTYNRTGSLFERPFRRILVTSDAYFSQLVYYIHFNPQKHGFVDGFEDWEYSSYHSHLENKPTKLNRDEVIKWFGGKSEYQKFHDSFQDVRIINPLIIEMD